MVDAGAEAIPATAAAFDLVTVAQAFHWFDAPVALAEIARVLRPGGMLALIWNEREESDPVMAEFSRIISWDERRPLRDVAHYSPAIERTGLFHAPEHHRFGHIERVSRQTLVEMAASRSYVNVMESEERAGVLGRSASWPPRSPSPLPSLRYGGLHGEGAGQALSRSPGAHRSGR